MWTVEVDEAKWTEETKVASNDGYNFADQLFKIPVGGSI